MLENKHGAMSDWLIASDIDGTLNNKKRKMPDNNYQAICRFVRESGGYFTLASGRSVPSIERFYRALPIEGMPVVVLNGAGIYDFSQNKYLDFDPMGEKAVDLILEAAELFPDLGVNIYTDIGAYASGKWAYSVPLLKLDHIKYEWKPKMSEVPRENWGKVIFQGHSWRIDALKKFFGTRKKPGAEFMASSVLSHEVLGEGVNKGSALLKLAGLLGIEPSHTAGIGDYFNDEGMIRAVGISGVCGQAPSELRELADYTACHCNYGAVADFLTFVEKKALAY